METRFVGNAATEMVLGLGVVARGGIPTWIDDVPADVEAAVEAVGDPTGEVWLHLLGPAIECGADADGQGLRRRLGGLDAEALIRLVLGVHVPAWRERVPSTALEAAATGDADAALQLLAAPGYYGGKARQALPTLLELGPDAARERILAAADAWVAGVADGCGDRIRAQHAEFDRDIPAGEDALGTVRRVTGGFRYEPEHYTREVVLVPHFSEPGWQVLAQHGDARIIAFDATGETRPRLEVLAEVFAALGEVSRLGILQRLAAEPGGVSDVARGTGLAKSTAHQHLSILRRAGLVALGGQAWRYRYETRPDRLREATEEVLELLGEEAGS